jgi:putative membrane protein
MKSGTNGFLRGTAAVVLTLCACSPQDRAAADSAADTTANRVGAAVDTAASRVGAAADTAARKMESAAGSVVKRGGWTDASIFGLVGAASAGEVREGQLAAKKATNPAVKKFAQQMVTDHRALSNNMKSLAAKLSVTPDTADGDVRDVMKDASDEVKELTDKPAGADWDKEYIDNQIDDHKDLLDKLQDAAKNTQNADLRAAIEKATGKVQEHLTKAQSIKENELKS